MGHVIYVRADATTFYRRWEELPDEWSAATCLFDHQCRGELLYLMVFNHGRAPDSPPEHAPQTHRTFLLARTTHGAFRFFQREGFWLSSSWEIGRLTGRRFPDAWADEFAPGELLRSLGIRRIPPPHRRW